MKVSTLSYQRSAENQELFWSELVESREAADALAVKYRRLGKTSGRKLTVKTGSRDVKFASRRFTVWIVVAYVQHVSVPCAVCEKPITWLRQQLGGHRCEPKVKGTFICGPNSSTHVLEKDCRTASPPECGCPAKDGAS